MVISNTLETSIFNELFALLQGTVKWLFIFQSLYDKASLCVRRHFISFQMTPHFGAPHFGAPSSFRLQISLSEKTSKGLQPETQHVRNLLSKETAGVSTHPRSLFIPAPDQLTHGPLWANTRRYKLGSLSSSTPVAGLQWEKLLVEEGKP